MDFAPLLPCGGSPLFFPPYTLASGQIKNKLKIDCFTNKVGKNFQYFVRVFYKTIIPLALVGCEMIIANEARTPSWLSTISYPTRTRGIIVK